MLLRITRSCLFSFCLAGLTHLAHAATDHPPDHAPRHGDRILFFGDSITQAGGYVLDVATYLVIRFPDRDISLVNHGLSSETISGTSETDHDPRRPNALDRFDRDVAAWRPTLVIACFGMNDGNYHPFEPSRFARFRDGVNQLLERCGRAGARLLILTPPPFDAYRRSASDPQAIEFGYKFPAIDYDQTLARYSQWLLTLRSPILRVVDPHTLMSRHLARRRESQVSFHLSPDAVHPGPIGHWLMAQALLESWSPPDPLNLLELAPLDSGPPVAATPVADLTPLGGEFTWVARLPLPFDPACDQQSLDLENVRDRFNRHTLRFHGLEPGRFRLLLLTDNGPLPLLERSAGEWDTGVDLTGIDSLPTSAQASCVRQSLADAIEANSRAWREAVRNGETPPVAWPDLRAFRESATPIPLRLRLEPVDSDRPGSP